MLPSVMRRSWDGKRLCHRVRTKNNVFRIEGTKRLVAGVAPDRWVIGTPAMGSPSFNTMSNELLTEREMLEKQNSPSAKEDGRPVLRPRHGPSAHRTQPTLNGPVPGAEMGDLKNEHFGAS
jgi:hypothetical protein